MMGSRNQRELNFRTGNRATIPIAWPCDIMDVLKSILEKSTLPIQFKKGSRVVFNRWEQMKDEQYLPLPAIVWKVIHFTTRPDMPKEKLVRVEASTNYSRIDVYQQDYDNLIEFQCYAATQEQTETLLHWLMEQLVTYRYALNDAGAQRILLDEGREDYVIPLMINKTPVRSVRYSMRTSRLFRSAGGPYLTSVMMKTSSSKLWMPVLGIVEVVKGEDILEDRLIRTILEVTNLDGTIVYYPNFDTQTRELNWVDSEPKPAEGETYRVVYLQYSEASLSAEIPNEYEEIE